MTKELDKYPIVDVAMSRIGHQYGESAKYRNFIKATLEPIVDLQSVFFNLLDIDIDTAKGIKFDLLGRLVGAPAVIPRAIPQPFFGFADQEQGQGFGELDDPEAGGHWREIGQQSLTDWVLDSENYRKAVSAQIVKNSSKCTPDEIIKVIKIIVGDDVVFKYIDYEMAVIIAPETPILTAQSRLIQTMVPRPAGVAFAVLNGQYEALDLGRDELEIIYDENE